jgi:hypothetical protein
MVRTSMRPVTGIPYRFAYHTTKAPSMPARSSPGMNPAMKSLATDCSADTQ